jgi:hypothetical protein
MSISSCPDLQDDLYAGSLRPGYNSSCPYNLETPELPQHRDRSFWTHVVSVYKERRSVYEQSSRLGAGRWDDLTYLENLFVVFWLGEGFRWRLDFFLGWECGWWYTGRHCKVSYSKGMSQGGELECRIWMWM